jgi:GrpB-like predicted nucleotidyltransferase (UPF0157 family)
MDEQESLAAAISEPVELRAYDPAWPSTFETERERLRSVLPGRFIDIQHVGSTAVPGLLAKPIIDILAGVESIAAAQSLVTSLCVSGYTTSHEFNSTLHDRRWFMRWADGRRTHHLHVVVHKGELWDQWLRFRDALRGSPELAKRYADLKADLAVQHASDREAYTAAKAEFIRLVTREPGDSPT